MVSLADDENPLLMRIEGAGSIHCRSCGFGVIVGFLRIIDSNLDFSWDIKNAPTL